jgi:hypothetical protein
LFKVAYGWGLRRTETAKLDVADWGRNPAAPEFDRYGMLHVRRLKVLMALLDILDTTMDQLIEPIAASQPARRSKASGGAEAGVGDLRPKRARITQTGS